MQENKSGFYEHSVCTPCSQKKQPRLLVTLLLEKNNEHGRKIQPV